MKKSNQLYKNKEWLIGQYVDLKKSMQTIASENNFSNRTVEKYLKLYEVKIRPNCEKGRINTWGKKTSETRKRMFIEGTIVANFLGKKHSEKSKEKQRLAKLGKKNTNISIAKKGKMLGEENPSFGKKGKDSFGYKGELCISPLHSQIRCLEKYKEWRTKIFSRDNYICQDCGSTSGNKEAHHIKSFSLILKENKIDSIEKAILCKILWDIKNGITLCKKCHKKTYLYFGNQYTMENRMNSGKA